MNDTDPPDRFVRVRGARDHNLKNVDVDIPRDSLVVFTGISGSGKSSLAFGTLYAEAQRRYFESVAPYALRLIDQVARVCRLHTGQDAPAAAPQDRAQLSGHVHRCPQVRASDLRHHALVGVSLFRDGTWCRLYPHANGNQAIMGERTGGGRRVAVLCRAVSAAHAGYQWRLDRPAHGS
jgi:hypothetical protein